jgi:hypothetical protein
MIKVDDILPFSESSWDKGISAGSSAEMEIHLTDKVTTIPQMRRILAVKGYQELRRRIESDVKGKCGLNALRAMADAMRSFALGHPGLSAACNISKPEDRQPGMATSTFGTLTNCISRLCGTRP